ncbi:hypothetical protein CMI42_05475 [Candidatus Pacearchaeota archaeon]|nr:hypothetical protein [Candidatus Pacearchaeota archaeon]|tara:strand:- start:946 stop:1158 length:213 start_codon:yes stop_codon:yes gene_type:complete
MKKDTKGKSGGVCHKCGTCSSLGWLFPIMLLAVALVPGWLASTWGKWVVVIIAALYLIKRVKPCKMCSCA